MFMDYSHAAMARVMPHAALRSNRVKSHPSSYCLVIRDEHVLTFRSAISKLSGATGQRPQTEGSPNVFTKLASPTIHWRIWAGMQSAHKYRVGGRSRLDVQDARKIIRRDVRNGCQKS